MDGKLVKARFPNWLELPDDVTELILKKLNLIDDYVRFGAVSMAWKSLCRQKAYLLPRQLPLLMIPNGSSSNALGVFSFDMKKAYSVNVQIPQHHHCVGSTEGWMVIEEENNRSLYLWRPFSSTNNKIDLPPLRGVTEVYAVQNVVLSADPASSTDFTVMVLLGVRVLKMGQFLCFYRSGDHRWKMVNLLTVQVSMVDHIFVGAQDLIYYNRQVYLVDHRGNVYICDISLPDPVPRHLAKFRGSENRDKFKFCYLVELSGELLVVQRLVDVCESHTLSTAGFEIFKLDVNSLKWNEVKSLGSHVLFLGDQASIATETSAFSGCVSNYIYFYKQRCVVLDLIFTDSGIFNLEDGSIERNVVKQEQDVILVEPKFSGF